MATDLVHLPPESVLDNVQQPIDIMIGEVAALIGGSDDPDTRDRALISLDRAADWMNMSGIFLFNKKDITYSVGGANPIADGDKTINLPADWGWPEDPILVRNSDNELVQVAEWVEWDVLQRMVEDTDATSATKSVPEWFAIKSENDDTASLYPFFGTARANSIVVNYVSRVQRPSETATITITPEAREALICGGEAFAMRQRHSSRPNVWQPFWRTFEHAIVNAKAAAHRRHQAIHTMARPDEAGRLTAAGPATVRRGVKIVYI